MRRYTSAYIHLVGIAQIFVALFLLFFALMVVLSIEMPDPDSSARNLGFDGYELVPGGSLAAALKRLPKGYQYLNYRYTIDGCSLSTFHRDVTSSPYVFKTRHPVYTFAVYNTPYGSVDLLSVCPGSHLTVPYLYASPMIISSNSGNTNTKNNNTKPPEKTGVLFHCDLVHAGAIPPNQSFARTRHVEQYKIAHVDDLPKLRHLDNIDTTKSGMATSLTT